MSEHGGWDACALHGSLVEHVLEGHVLVDILACLGLQERHRAALVCRHWHQVTHHPRLLRSIGISLECTNAAVLPAFCSWLQARAAGHVQRLELALRARGLAHALRGEAAAAQLFAALRACARGPLPLQELALLVDSQLAIDPRQLGALCATLRCLRLNATSKSHESASTALYCFALHELTALRELRLCGTAVELHRSGLPPTLTLLHLSGHRDLTARNRHSPPQQLEALSQLRSLHLRGVYVNTPHCYNPLLRLPALERLALTGCTHLPACLPRLTTLKVLCLSRAPMDERSRAPELAAALHSLTGLTHLVLSGLSFPEPGVPPPLAGLPPEVALQLQRLAHLRRFFWTQQPQQQGGGCCADKQEDHQPSPSLPCGPWLASLSALALDLGMAASQGTLQALSGATQLQALALHGSFAGAAALSQVAAVLAWAGRHRPLRRLALGHVGSSRPCLGSSGSLSQVLQLGDPRPGLSIELGGTLLSELGCLCPGSGPDQPLDFAF